MILATAFVYNEKPYIDQWAKWYKSQGCELFILDNMSRDGTWEWLQENNIPSARCDTGDSFHLHKLQDVLMKHIAKIKPDWVVYTGADLFIITKDKLSATIDYADKKGFNQISLPTYSVVNTGETFGLPLQKHFTRGGVYRHLVLVAKYGKGFTIRNDNVGVEDKKPVKPKGIIVNYGGCKPKSEQEEKLKRREKAWKEGLRKNIGKHFLKGKKKGWIYHKESAKDLSKSWEWNYIKKTISTENQSCT